GGHGSSAGSFDRARIPSDAALLLTSRLTQVKSGRRIGSSDASSTDAMFGGVWDETWPSESPVTGADARNRRASSQPMRAIWRRYRTILFGVAETADSIRCWLPNGTTQTAPGRAAWNPLSTLACA